MASALLFCLNLLPRRCQAAADLTGPLSLGEARPAHAVVPCRWWEGLIWSGPLSAGVLTQVEVLIWVSQGHVQLCPGSSIPSLPQGDTSRPLL